MTAPAICVTGFLGAGKSTLVAQLRDGLGPGCTVLEGDGRVAPALDPALDPVVVGTAGAVMLAVADAANVVACLADPLIGPLVAAQLRGATIVVLARTDIVPEAPAREAVARVTDAPVVVAQQGAVPPETLDRLLAMAPSKPGGDAVCVPFAEWRYEGPAVLREAPLEALCGERVAGLYRLSGLVRGRRAGVEVQRAGRVRQTQVVAQPVETRLIAIGPAERFRPDDMALRFSEAAASSSHLSGLFGHR